MSNNTGLTSTSVKIVGMARDLIRLSGKKPDTGIEIALPGLHPATHD